MPVAGQVWNVCSMPCYPFPMAAYVPPGWPTGVHPPGSEEFERTAVAWLLDVVPPDYRLYGVLRRHPVALAVMARYHLSACVEGARQGYRTARTELGGTLPPHGLEAVLAAYRSEGKRLVATAHAVDLVCRALQGEQFTPRLREQHGHPGRGAGQVEEIRQRRRLASVPPANATPSRQARSATSCAASLGSLPPRGRPTASTPVSAPGPSG